MPSSNKPTTLTEYPVVVELPIQWGDLDAYGHVNNIAYLKWFEAARAEYAMRVGVAVTPDPNGYGAALVDVRCRFLRQANYPAIVLVGVRISRMTIGSVTIEFKVVDSSTGVALAEGGSDAVIYDNSAGRPTPIPARIRKAVEELEGRDFGST